MLSAALAAFLSLCLFFAGGAQAWLATSYYQQSFTTMTREGAATTYVTTYTYQEAVKPTVTSFAPLSVETSTDSYEMTVVNILVPTGVASVIDSYDEDYYHDYTSYFVDITLSANPTRCTESDEAWVWTTTAYVEVPYGVVPTPLSVSTSEYQASAFGPTTTYTQAFLNPTDVPSAYLYSKSSSIVYYNDWATYSCTVPSSYRSGLVAIGSQTVAPATATGTATTGGSATGASASAAAAATAGGSGPYAAMCAAELERYADQESYSGYYSSRYSPDYRYDYDGLGIGYYKYCDSNSACRCFHGLRWWALIPICIGSWVGFFLIVGCIESYINFRALCRGRSARRGVPLAFTALMFPWSCFFLCCSKRGYTKKTPAEQLELEAEWKAMGFGTKLGRWLKWGFRYKYPTFLGAVPFRRTKWEEKDIAKEVARRLSVSDPVMRPDGSLPLGPPVVGQNVSSYYAPQAPAAAYAAPGVAPRDFAQQEDRGIGRNRHSVLHSVPEGDGPLPPLPPRTPPTEDVVSPVSPINPAAETVAGPAPKSPKGKGKELVTDEPAVGSDAPQLPPVAVAK